MDLYIIKEDYNMKYEINVLSKGKDAIKEEKVAKKSPIYFENIDADISQDILGDVLYNHNYNGKGELSDKLLDSLSPYGFIKNNLDTLLITPFMTEDLKYDNIQLQLKAIYSKVINTIKLDTDNIYSNGLLRIIRDNSMMNDHIIDSLYNFHDLNSLFSQFAYADVKRIYLNRKEDDITDTDIGDLMNAMNSLLYAIANTYYDIIASMVFHRQIRLIGYNSTINYNMISIEFDAYKFLSTDDEFPRDEVEDKSLILSKLQNTAAFDISKMSDIIELNLMSGLYAIKNVLS